jgi:hypothetical protein
MIPPKTHEEAADSDHSGNITSPSTKAVVSNDIQILSPDGN